jgi:transcriptional regulator with XRE-family HTH domain
MRRVGRARCVPDPGEGRLGYAHSCSLRASDPHPSGTNGAIRAACNAGSDMRPARRTQAEIAGARETQRIAATLGSQVRATRGRRRLTQTGLGRRVGVGQSRISEIERGHGARATLELWIALGVALDRPLAVTLSRDITIEPADAGHLAIQELVMRLALVNDRAATFELPTRPADPARSIDVGIRDNRRRTLIAIEIWNRLDDLGAAVRAHDRKLSETRALTVAIARSDRPYRVASCWILRDTAANRGLVARYPAILRSRFRGSSLAGRAPWQPAASRRPSPDSCGRAPMPGGSCRFGGISEPTCAEGQDSP